MSLYTEPELRAIIGGPTTDPTEVGYVSVQMLQDIIDRYTDQYEELIDRKITEAIAQGIPLFDTKDLERVTITLTEPLEDGLSEHYVEGIVDPIYYPYTNAKGYDVDGFIYTFDPNIEETVYLSFITKRRFKFYGNKVMVIPPEIDEIVILLPTKETVKEQVGIEFEQQINDLILRDALTLLQNRIAEGTRLRQGLNDA